MRPSGRRNTYHSSDIKHSKSHPLLLPAQLGTATKGVLGKLMQEFKSRVAKLFEAGQTIPWIDPPGPPRENEQIRSIPMHL